MLPASAADGPPVDVTTEAPGRTSSAPAVVPEEDKPLSSENLEAQDSMMTTKIIKLLEDNESFAAFAEAEGLAIKTRDDEDGQKLQAGIQFAIHKGVLPEKEFDPYMEIDVLGKTPDEVTEVIVKRLGRAFKGGVLVLVGLSGTGKGTTVEMLKSKLPNATTWSNGNVFRSLTLLAVSHCLKEGLNFAPSVLTPENIAAWIGMLEFGEYDGKFDIHINGLGHDLFVSQVANTVLKGPMVGANIPTVAEASQGEVVKFASAACHQMGSAGQTVLLEGREQTVNYIDSPHRFELTLSDATLIGKRRAAQRIGAKALEVLESGGSRTLEAADTNDVNTAVLESLASLQSA